MCHELFYVVAIKTSLKTYILVSFVVFRIIVLVVFRIGKVSRGFQLTFVKLKWNHSKSIFNEINLL